MRTTRLLAYAYLTVFAFYSQNGCAHPVDGADTDQEETIAPAHVYELAPSAYPEEFRAQTGGRAGALSVERYRALIHEAWQDSKTRAEWLTLTDDAACTDVRVIGATDERDLTEMATFVLSCGEKRKCTRSFTIMRDAARAVMSWRADVCNPPVAASAQALSERPRFDLVLGWSGNLAFKGAYRGLQSLAWGIGRAAQVRLWFVRDPNGKGWPTFAAWHKIMMDADTLAWTSGNRAKEVRLPLYPGLPDLAIALSIYLHNALQ